MWFLFRGCIFLWKFLSTCRSKMWWKISWLDCNKPTVKRFSWAGSDNQLVIIHRLMSLTSPPAGLMVWLWTLSSTVIGKETTEILTNFYKYWFRDWLSFSRVWFQLISYYVTRYVFNHIDLSIGMHRIRISSFLCDVSFHHWNIKILEHECGYGGRGRGPACLKLGLWQKIKVIF